MKMLITVDEVFDNDHRVVNKRDAHAGRFTFSAADPGNHKICLTPETNAATGGWLSGAPAGAVRVTLDMAIGETSKIESEDKGKMTDLVQRVKDLNSRLQDIRREQVFQRVCSLFFFLNKKQKQKPHTSRFAVWGCFLRMNRVTRHETNQFSLLG